jgi:hypothetical protein
LSSKKATAHQGSFVSIGAVLPSSTSRRNVLKPSGWNTRNDEFDCKKENVPDSRTDAGEGSAERAHAGQSMAGRPAVECDRPFHKRLMDLGVDGWWPDQGTGSARHHGWRVTSLVATEPPRDGEQL